MNGPTRLRLRIAVATMATAVAMLLGASAHCPVLRPASPTYQETQLLLTSGGNQTLKVESLHRRTDGSVSSCPPKALALAALPQPTTVLAALGVVAVLGALAGPLARRVVPTGRGPPPGRETYLTGQAILTRFCLARR